MTLVSPNDVGFSEQVSFFFFLFLLSFFSSFSFGVAGMSSSKEKINACTVAHRGGLLQVYALQLSLNLRHVPLVLHIAFMILNV